MPTDRLSAAQNDYLMTVHRQLSVMLGRRFAPHIVDELVQTECLRLAERIGTVLHDYPDPVVYAKVRATGRHALLGMLRTDDVQAGRGARRLRTVVDGDHRHDDGSTAFDEYAHLEACRHDGDEADRLDRLERLRHALGALSPRARTLLYLVDGEGYTVTDAARRLRIARETAARTRSAALRVLAAAC